jgi:hypothetical protein
MAIRALAVELSPWKARLAGGPSLFVLRKVTFRFLL